MKLKCDQCEEIYDIESERISLKGEKIYLQEISCICGRIWDSNELIKLFGD